LGSDLTLPRRLPNPADTPPRRRKPNPAGSLTNRRGRRGSKRGKTPPAGLGMLPAPRRRRTARNRCAVAMPQVHGACRSENERPLSQTRFGSQLRERGFRQAERDARGRKQWDGLRLNDVGERLASDARTARTARTVRGHFRHERDSFSRESLMPKSGSDCSDHSADWGQA
jgi:hypothetical protein